MRLSGTTHLHAILAHPAAHVRAAEFFNPVFAAKGVDAFLMPFHVLPEDLADVVRHLRGCAICAAWC